MRNSAKVKPSSSAKNNKKSCSSSSNGGGGGGNNNNKKVVDKFIGTMAELRIVLGRNDVPATLVAILMGHSNAKAPIFDTVKTQLVKNTVLQVTNKGCLRFTSKGMDAIPSSISRPTDNKQAQDLLRRMLHTTITTLDDSCVGGGGGCYDSSNKNNVNVIFNRLLDGHVHTRDELVGQMSNTKAALSFGTIVKALKDLNLIAKGRTQELQMTNTAFPFGRPYG